MTSQWDKIIHAADDEPAAHIPGPRQPAVPAPKQEQPAAQAAAAPGTGGEGAPKKRRGKGRPRKGVWDQEHAFEMVTYRGVPPELHAQVRAIAEAEDLPVGNAAAALLAYAVAAYKAGTFKIAKTPTRMRAV